MARAKMNWGMNENLKYKLATRFLIAVNVVIFSAIGLVVLVFAFFAYCGWFGIKDCGS